MNRPITSRPLSSITDSYASSNTRKPPQNDKVRRLYPWLLFLSTATAAIFCLAYITKPVVLTYPADSAIPGVSQMKPLPSMTPPAPNSIGIEAVIPPAPMTSGYEETNIRMQHILDVESPSGDIQRMVIDVPALYKSRNLRWSQDDAAQARILLQRLEQFQEKAQALRDEGKQLSHEWNNLMDGSMPHTILRADSPSLSTNLKISTPSADGATKLPSHQP
jgi:hypothetical protein